MSPGSRVRGTVLDSTGAPVPGAQVIYTGVSDWSIRASERLDGVTSDKRGRFSFDALPQGSFRFTATADGFAPGFSEMVTLHGKSESSDIIVVMEAAATLHGRVITRLGERVASARVRVIAKSSGMMRGRDGTRQVFCDEKGEFELAGLLRKDYEVIAIDENASSDVLSINLGVSPYEVDIEIPLALDGVIAGMVVDSKGEPIDGAQVSAFPNFRKGAQLSSAEWQLRGGSSELTDAGGRFMLKGLKSDVEYLIRAYPGTSNSATRTWLLEGVTAQVGEQELRIVLPADGSIFGKVTFANGIPPKAFTVSVGWQRGTPFSSKEGKFKLENLPPQTYIVRANGADMDQVELTGIEIQEGQNKDLGTIIVKQGRKVTGRVLDITGGALEGALVSAGRLVAGDGSNAKTVGPSHPLARSTKTATSDENGEFAIYGISLGDFSIVADHPEKGRSLPIRVQMTNESIRGLILPVLEMGSLEGVVRRNGKLEADVIVSANSLEFPAVVASVVSGPDGKFRFDRLTPDMYRVKAMTGGGGMQGMSFFSKHVEIQANNRATMEIDFEEGGTTLTVNLIAEGTLGFTRLSIVSGIVHVKNARELEAIIGASSGFEGFGMSIRGMPATARNLIPGRYTVCAFTYPVEVKGMRGTMDYMVREGNNLSAVCEKVEIGSDLKQSMTMHVTIPDYVPKPNIGSEEVVPQSTSTE